MQLQSTYKNISKLIVRIEDLGLRFSPAGKHGDTVDLSNFVSAKAILQSSDLQAAIRKGWIVSMIKPTAKQLQTQKNKKPPHVFVRNPSDPKPVQTTQPVVAYNYQEKRLESPSVIPQAPMAIQHTVKAVATVEETPPVEQKTEEQPVNPIFCAAMKKNGQQCKHKPQIDSDYCYLHAAPLE